MRYVHKCIPGFSEGIPRLFDVNGLPGKDRSCTGFIRPVLITRRTGQQETEPWIIPAALSYPAISGEPPGRWAVHPGILSCTAASRCADETLSLSHVLFFFIKCPAQHPELFRGLAGFLTLAFFLLRTGKGVLDQFAFKLIAFTAGADLVLPDAR